MHARGVPDEQIVVMVYDDVVKSFFNTRKGQMYNEPNGPDVYEGVPKDYTNKNITPKNFLAVLRGDAAAMQSVPGTGRVIDSGPNDRIFVYFADHGAPGMLAFPSKVKHPPYRPFSLPASHSDPVARRHSTLTPSARTSVRGGADQTAGTRSDQHDRGHARTQQVLADASLHRGMRVWINVQRAAQAHVGRAGSHCSLAF